MNAVLVMFGVVVVWFLQDISLRLKQANKLKRLELESKGIISKETEEVESSDTENSSESN